jgi:hypothetical protein
MNSLYFSKNTTRLECFKKLNAMLIESKTRGFHLILKKYFLLLKIHILPFVVLACLLLNGCVEPFEFSSNKYDNFLVVDGLFTNAAGPFSVKLSRTYQYNSHSETFEQGAIVKILDDLGNTISLKEGAKGIYKTDSATQGVVGRKYKLFIQTKDGESYESSFDEIIPVPPIDSLYYTYKKMDNPEDASNPIEGVQVYVETHDPGNISKHYKWDYEESWKIILPFSVSLYPDVCYESATSSTFMIEDATRLSENKIKNHPLYYISNQTNRLCFKYCSKIKQYSLSENAFNYFNQIIEVNNHNGSLYDVPPSPVYGNINCISNPSLKCLGYFQVSGESSKVIVVDKANDLSIKFMYVPNGFTYCELADVPTSDFLQIQQLIKKGYVFIYQYFNGKDQENHSVYANSIKCVDCALSGSVNPPSYWAK